MNSNPEQEPSPPPEIGFAPADYTDGRQRDQQGVIQWQTMYPLEARKRIAIEAIYLALLLGVSLYLIYCCLRDYSYDPPPATASKVRLDFPLYAAAGLAGVVGGTIFSIKWLVHSVAKRIWHKDRLLWRLFTPHVSGVLAAFMVLLIASGLIRVFDDKFFQTPVAALGISFIVGYFSDKALAKMAELADTLFGTTK